MAHECPYCGQQCYCDCDDTGGLAVPSDCPHLNGECEADQEEYDGAVFPKVTRTNLHTALVAYLSIEQAVEELSQILSAQTFGSRLAILAALCNGQTIETNTYSYFWPKGA
jgi:hypothetical protein